MQPRREREDDVSEMVFHVTKRGLSEMLLERCEVRRGCRPMGAYGECVGGVLAAVLGARELDEEELTDEEEREAESRWRAARRGCSVAVCEGSGESGSSSCGSADSLSFSSSSRPLGYSAQDAWTW